MKRFFISIMAFITLVLSTSTAQAVFWARQVYKHKTLNKTAELYYDAHVQGFMGIIAATNGWPDQKEMFDSLDIINKIEAQQKDFVDTMCRDGKATYVLAEDMLEKAKGLLEKIKSEKVEGLLVDQVKDSLGLLINRCEKANIKNCRIENLEIRDPLFAIPDPEMQAILESYNDGKSLNALYKEIKQTLLSANPIIVGLGLFDIHMIHKVHDYTKSPDIANLKVAAGSGHLYVLRKALSLMGYELQKTDLHEDVKALCGNVATIPSGFNDVVKQEILGWLYDSSLERIHKIYTSTSPDTYWTLVFLATHPIDIAAIIEQEEKEKKEKESKAEAATRVAEAPAVRSRL